MISYSVSGFIIIAVMIILAIILWKVAKILLIPVQIALFLLLMFIAYKYFLTQENMDNITIQVDNERIQEMVNKATDSASKLMDDGKEAIKRSVEEKIRDTVTQAGNDFTNAINPADKTESAVQKPVSGYSNEATQQ